jgi:molecular chaperone GrpE
MNQDTAAETNDAVGAVREPAQDEAMTKVQKQAQEYLDGWQRERAEFSNYRKRVENQLKDSYQNASLELLKKLIPIIDDYERAMNSVPEASNGQPWLDGITLIYRKFQKILEEYGVAAVDPVGEPFDPNLHEAVGTDDSTDAKSGHVTTCLQKGYVYCDRVLRPALVRVAL